MKNEQITFSVAFRLSMLLLAVLPLTEGDSAVYYTCAAICGVLFISAVVMALIVCRGEKWNLSSLMRADKRIDIVDVVIAVVGIIVCTMMEYYRFSLFWWACLLVGLCRILVRVRKGIYE